MPVGGVTTVRVSIETNGSDVLCRKRVEHVPPLVGGRKRREIFFPPVGPGNAMAGESRSRGSRRKSGGSVKSRMHEEKMPERCLARIGAGAATPVEITVPPPHGRGRHWGS